jgi:hypothetical protein
MPARRCIDRPAKSSADMAGHEAFSTESVAFWSVGNDIKDQSSEAWFVA